MNNKNPSQGKTTQLSNRIDGNTSNNATLKGKLTALEDAINEIATEMGNHKNEVNHLKSEKDSIHELLKSKHHEVKDTLLQDLSKVEEEMQRHFGHQKAENSKLQSQISVLKTEKTVLQSQLLALQRRITDLEMQVGNDDEKMK